MNRRNGRAVCPAAEKFINTENGSEVCWQNMHRDGEQFPVAGIEMFADKGHL